MGKKYPPQEFMEIPARNFFAVRMGMGSQNPTGISPLPSLVFGTRVVASSFYLDLFAFLQS
jgi:hypothetical protein